MSDDLETSQHTVQTADGPMPVYQASPAQAPRGAVVVVQEAFGVTEHIEDVCRRLAAAGWLAAAPSLFHRQGAPVLRYDDFAAVRPIVTQLSAQGVRADVDACLGHFGSSGFEPARCAIVGFCMGGTVAFYTAVERSLGAAATFYGGGIASGRFGLPSQVEVAPTLLTPWFGAYGDRDRGIPPAEVDQLRAAAQRSSVDVEVVRYPNADHGFNCDDRPSVYDADAAADAWARTLAWFEDHIPAS